MALSLLLAASSADGFVLLAPPQRIGLCSQLQPLVAPGPVAAAAPYLQPACPQPLLCGRASPSAIMMSATPEDPEHEAKVAKALKAMVGFSNSYVKNTDTRYCSDPSIPAVVIKGLAEHKVVLGAPLCPCRHYEDKEAEAKDGYWNCPCVPMRERHECHCMLFLTKDNEFAGENQALTVEETVEYTSGMTIL